MLFISNIWNASFIKKKRKLLRKRTLHRSKMCLDYCVRRRRKRPFFILAARRTGSNLLLSYLNSVPNISFAAEILNQDMWYGVRGRFISKRSVLRHIAHSINNCEYEVCGAKFIEVQLERHDIKPMDLVSLFPEARFIVLYRRSILEQLLSLKIAELTNAWQWTKDFRVPVGVNIPPADLISFHERTTSFYHSILEDPALNGRSIILTYEELTLEPQKTFNGKIFPFLDLNSSIVTSNLRKQNTKRPQDLLVNHAALSRMAENELILPNGGLAKYPKEQANKIC